MTISKRLPSNFCRENPAHKLLEQWVEEEALRRRPPLMTQETLAA
jgi:hypothetical protein